MRVSITDPGMTLMHRDQTVWGLVSTCGHAVVVDEDVSAHTHLGDIDLGMRPDMSAGVLEDL